MCCEIEQTDSDTGRGQNLLAKKPGLALPEDEQKLAKGAKNAAHTHILSLFATFCSLLIGRCHGNRLPQLA